jgi:hypothetical protein
MPLITGISDRMIALELGHPIVEGTPQEVTTDARVVSSYLGGDLAVINRSGASAPTDPAPAPQAKPKAKPKAKSTAATGNGQGNGTNRAVASAKPLVAAAEDTR